jgi:hypothetical protein
MEAVVGISRKLLKVIYTGKLSDSASFGTGCSRVYLCPYVHSEDTRKRPQKNLREKMGIAEELSYFVPPPPPFSSLASHTSFKAFYDGRIASLL